MMYTILCALTWFQVLIGLEWPIYNFVISAILILPIILYRAKGKKHVLESFSAQTDKKSLIQGFCLYTLIIGVLGFGLSFAALFATLPESSTSMVFETPADRLSFFSSILPSAIGFGFLFGAFMWAVSVKVKAINYTAWAILAVLFIYDMSGF